MRSGRLCAGVAGLVILAGCGSKPVASDVADPIADDKYLVSPNLYAGYDAGRLIVTRDGGYAASACDCRVSIDGTPAAMVGPAESAEFMLKPGTHRISAGPSGSILCNGSAAEMEVQLPARQTRFMRATVNFNGAYTLQRVAY